MLNYLCLTLFQDKGVIKLLFKQIKQMRTFKINPEATLVDYSVEVEAKDLSDLGWSFDENIRNTMDARNISFEEAEEYVLGLGIRLYFESREEGGIACLWAFDLDGADREDSGDDEKSLEDLLHIVNNGLIYENTESDYSENKEGVFVDFLIEG